MGMASGESGVYFGTDVGQWGAKGAGNLFVACRRGNHFFFYPLCLHSKCLDFCGEFKCG